MLTRQLVQDAPHVPLCQLPYQSRGFVRDWVREAVQDGSASRTLCSDNPVQPWHAQEAGRSAGLRFYSFDHDGCESCTLAVQ